MSLTLRQEVSNIRNATRMNNSDFLISDRFIASLLRSAANLIILQVLDKRKLLNSPNIFSPILCLEMEKIPLSSCCNYEGPRQIAKSKKKLPQIGEGTFGLAIQMVTGLDRKRKFIETNPNRYANLLELDLRTSDIYYWVESDHLFCTNEDTESAELFAYFTEDIPNDLLFPGVDCKCSAPPDINDICINPLDKPFKVPASRINDIRNIVIDHLSKTFLRLKTDDTSNNKED